MMDTHSRIPQILSTIITLVTLTAMHSISDVFSDELTLVPLQNKKGTFIFNNSLGFVSMQLRCGPVLGCARLIAA